MSNSDQNIISKELSFYSLASAKLLESAKVTPILNKDRYPELTRFKQFLQEEGTDPLYYLEKHAKRAQRYRLIFFGFGALFLIFLVLILMQNTTPFYSLFFGSRLLAKVVPCTVCGIFSLISLTIAVEIQTEKEAIHFLIQKAKQQLNRIYTQKRAAIGWKFILAYLLRLDRRATAVIATYHETIDKIHEAKDAAIALIEQIGSAKHLESGEYERLANQAIGTMQDQLRRIIHQYTQQ